MGNDGDESVCWLNKYTANFHNEQIIHNQQAMKMQGMRNNVKSTAKI
jgi:hypothetical protein